MGQALYRKYRSKKLSEIVGQEHITKTLERAIKAGKLSHAYLFTGPRGVGKTSIARILAHEVNDLPYTDESIHLDIIEIDAASNRRIDEIRDLRDKVHIAPTSAKYKVYIIDEVHMLTKEAFNALLKTLEEPPAHVIFILATTEAHKLPDTIVSRTQRFTFKAIEQAKAAEYLGELAKKEGMQVDQDALELLAEHGGGSFRDAIGLLDQIGNSQKHVTKQDVETMIGIAPSESIISLMTAINSSPKAIIDSLDSFSERGIAPAQVAKQLSATIRLGLLENKLNIDHRVATTLLEALLNVPSSPNPGAALELSLFNASLDVNAPSHPAKEQIVKLAPEKVVIEKSKTASQPVVKEVVAEPVQVQQTVTIEAGQNTEPEPILEIKNSEDISAWWGQLVNAIKKHNNTLYGILRMAHPSFSDDILTLGFAFGFHAKKLGDTQTAAKLQDEIKSLTGKDVTVKAVHNKDLKGVTPVISPIAEATASMPVADAPVTTPDLGAITNIFGATEVLES